MTELSVKEVAVITARLSELSEDDALNYFWLMMRQGADHLTVLEWMTRVTIQRPHDWNRAAVRQAHEQRRARIGWTIDSQSCYGCADGDRRKYFHHIIEVQNGGSNAVRNGVPLCFTCHKHLHPWLTTEPTPKRVSGFFSLADIAASIGSL